MITGRSCFNIYLCALLVFVACGCRSTKDDEKKKMSTLRLHMQTGEAPGDFSVSVPIYRENPVDITVDKDPFITEANVVSARVVDQLGGFALRIEFDHTGTLLLEEYTTANPGLHIAIFSAFGKSKHDSRWLAAPLISKRISNGILIFAPDASREEAERIALGLNNVHDQAAKKYKW